MYVTNLRKAGRELELLMFTLKGDIQIEKDYEEEH
ncbi:hypothetical protein ERICIII_04804 (plasmid) [Paenibacillus larvae subsp. larvae]|uniref:Uncharacterized protein n=1 Tax=Paenibacillus larvae subsp. larvae TaxID=147375 RepID=A0A2L1U7G3_9BACL|nr:hypothetical protein ERICIII_04804 [Paenibacillus larvae subsp. larvae]